MECCWMDWSQVGGASFWCWLAGLLAVGWVLLAMRRRRRPLVVTSGDLGTVTISMRALRGAIRSCCFRAEERIKPCCIAIGRKKNHLRIRLCLRVPEGCNVQAIAQRIQDIATAQLRDQFGLDDGCSIDVQVTGFFPANRPAESQPCNCRSGEPSRNEDVRPR